MSVCNFAPLSNLTLEDARKSIRQYSSLPGPWLYQYDKYFGTTRETAAPDIRLLELLEVVRGSGWAMNRKGQCAHITNEIRKGRISREELECFWSTVDSLPDVGLRDLPCMSRNQLKKIERTFDNIRQSLRKWHSSSDSLCFLTKVILMFNWGQSPAFDTRIRNVLNVKNNISNKTLVEALIEIGIWIQNFESKHDIQLNKLAADEMNSQKSLESLNPLPLGRSFDMMLFLL